MSNKQVKLNLAIKHGSRCMLCERKLKSNERTLHHIIPISNGGETTEENGAILCAPCQSIIHLFNYEEEPYIKITKRIYDNLKKYTKK